MAREKYHVASDVERASAIYLIERGMSRHGVSRTVTQATPSAVGKWWNQYEEGRFDPVQLTEEQIAELDRLLAADKAEEPAKPAQETLPAVVESNGHKMEAKVLEVTNGVETMGQRAFVLAERVATLERQLRERDQELADMRAAYVHEIADKDEEIEVLKATAAHREDVLTRRIEAAELLLTHYLVKEHQ